MSKCPKCGAEAKVPFKEWVYATFRVRMYQCGCGKRFREYLREGKVRFVL